MRLRISVAALAALTLLPAATAAAAPNRSGSLPAENTKYTWSTAVQTGAVYTSTVSGHVPACSPLFSCDATLVKTDVLGDLQVDIAGQGVNGQDTLKDVDLHVYSSDASGTQGDLQAQSTGATASESVSLPDLEPGYYLVYLDWYLGVGSVDGTAQLFPPTPPDDGGF
jgi:hypothetical protein